MPSDFRWRYGSGTTPPHSTQRTFPALCSSSVTLSEIRRLWVQAQEGLIEVGGEGGSGLLTLTMYLQDGK